MTKPQKKLLLNLTFGFGALVGLIMSMFIFMSPRDLKNYTRLTDGAGETVQATSEGAAASVRSGSRRSSGTVRYCTSWVFEVNGNPTHFTDKRDCYDNAEDAKSGTTTELIYDPADLSIVFIHSDETLQSLKGSQTAFRIASIVGVVVLAGSIVGLVKVNRSSKPAHKES